MQSLYYETENDLDTDDIRGLVLRLGTAIHAGSVRRVFYSIVDRMYIGNIPKIGEVAHAGVGICGPIVTLVSSFAILVGVGGAPLMSIRLGQKNEKGARQILANCFLMLTVMPWSSRSSYWACGKAALVVWLPERQPFPMHVLYDHLSVRNLFCADDYGHEPVYYLPGLCKGWHEGRYDRGSGQYRAGSHFYFRPAS